MKYFKDDVELEITYMDTPDDPREWENLGTMVCFHGKYRLGDNHDIDYHDYNSWQELKKVVMKKYGKPAICFPLYMMDHSGLTIKTTPFGGMYGYFDSGQIGWIMVTAEKGREYFQTKRFTKKYREKAIKVLLDEIETYNSYINGEVYCYETYDRVTGNHIDSCCGFYSIEDVFSYIYEDEKDWIKIEE